MLLLCCVPFAAGQAAPARTLRFEQLSVDHGLVQESVLAMIEDRDGFMWFGTQAGLARFDGYRFVTYRNVVGDPRSLVNNWVRALHMDRAGRMWIGTDGGLDRFDPETQTFIHYAPQRRGNGNRHVQAIASDGAQGLWLATSDGFQHFDMDTGTFKIWHHSPDDSSSLASDQVNALAVDISGRVWIGTQSGLDSLDPGAQGFTHHPAADPDLKYNLVR